jgi:tetratricopeptide (TPR) repeat protein
MLKTCHLLMMIFLCLNCTLLQAAGLKDTTARSFFKVATPKSVNPEYDIEHLMAGAISKIQHDSTGQGVDDLLQAMQALADSKQIDRVLTISGTEMLGILQMMRSADADDRDRKLGYQFVKGAFGELDSARARKFERVLYRSYETPFNKRLTFYIDYFAGNRLTERSVRAYLKADTTSFFANALLAGYLYDTERYYEAIRYCNRIIKAKPTYAVMYELRGKCFAGIQRRNEAMASYNQALQLFPLFCEASYDKGELLMDMDRSEEEAKNNFLQMYNVKADYKWCAYNLARAYRRLNQLDSALYYVNESIRNNPNDGDGYNIKADVYLAKKEYKTAINYYDQAISLEPKKSRFYEHRGDARAYDDQIDSAIIDYNKAFSLDSTRIYPLLRVGDCHIFGGKAENAIPYFKKALKINPANVYSRVALNRAYTQLKNYPEAINEGLKAVAADSTYASALGNLGRTYYCAGDFDKCVQYSYKAIAYDEQTVYAMFNIALATLRKGETAKATDLYRQFVKTCLGKHYEITDNAVDDLKELVKQHVYEKEAQFIINQIFGPPAKV